MAAEQVVEATILAVEPDGNGWSKIRTDQGDFSTKYPEPIAEAQANLGQRGLIAYEMGSARPKNDGSGYWPAPRYFKRVAATGYQQPQAFGGNPQSVQSQPMHPSVQAFQERMQQPQPQPPIQQNLAPPQERDRDLRIMRQTAGKLAVHTMALVPSEQRTFQNQIAIAEAWVRYFVGGPPEQRVAQQEQAMAAVGMHPDPDDIPF